VGLGLCLVNFLRCRESTYVKWDLPLGIKTWVSFWKEVRMDRMARGSRSVLAKGLLHILERNLPGPVATLQFHNAHSR